MPRPLRGRGSSGSSGFLGFLGVPQGSGFQGSGFRGFEVPRVHPRRSAFQTAPVDEPCDRTLTLRNPERGTLNEEPEEPRGTPGAQRPPGRAQHAMHIAGFPGLLRRDDGRGSEQQPGRTRDPSQSCRFLQLFGHHACANYTDALRGVLGCRPARNQRGPARILVISPIRCIFETVKSVTVTMHGHCIPPNLRHKLLYSTDCPSHHSTLS